MPASCIDEIEAAMLESAPLGRVSMVIGNWALISVGGLVILVLRSLRIGALSTGSGTCRTISVEQPAVQKAHARRQLTGVTGQF